MAIDVINPDESTDPLQLSQNRDLPSTPVQPQQNVQEEIPVLPPQEPAPSMPEPIRIGPELRNIDTTVGVDNSQPVVVGDVVPEAPMRFDIPTFQHPQLRYPTTNPTIAAGPDIGQAMADIITDPMSELNALELVGDPITQVQNISSLRSNYVRNEADIEHYKRHVLDTNSVASRRAAAITSMVTPPGEGIAGPNAFVRNVMSGRPFHPATEDGLRQQLRVPELFQQFKQLGEVVRDYVEFSSRETLRNLERSQRDTFLQALPVNTGLAIAGALGNNRQVRRTMRGLAADLSAATGRVFTEYRFIPDEIKQLRRNVVESIRGPVPNRGNVVAQAVGVVDPELGNALMPQTALGRFAESSPAFIELLSQIEPRLDSNGEAIFNPLQGSFGDFGNAGALSALLYLANIPEGILTGGLYELTALVGRGVAGVTNVPVSEVLPANRPGLGSALLGRDLGIMQRYREGSNYLSFVGNPSLEWLPRKGQWYGGFLVDMAIGGIADAPIDALMRRLRRTTLRSARQAIPPTPNLTPPPLTTVLQRPEPTAPLEVTNRAANAVTPTPPVTNYQNFVNQTLQTPVRLNDSVALVPMRTIPETTTEAGNLARIARGANDLQDVVRTARASIDTRQAFNNSVNSIHNLLRANVDNYRDTVGSIVRQTGAVVDDGIIVRSNPTLDAVIPTVPYNNITPGFARWSDALTTYRTTPDLDPRALEFVRRTDEQLISIAKQYGILEPDERLIGSMRLRAMQELYPELLSAWGKNVGENITAPSIRLLSPADPIQSLPETSTVVDTPPTLRAINPDGGESLRSIFRRFDDFADSRPYLNADDNNPISLDARRQARDFVRENMGPVLDTARNVTNIDNARQQRRLNTLSRQANNTDPDNVVKLRRIETEAQNILDLNPRLKTENAEQALPPDIDPQDAGQIITDTPVALREAEIASDLRNQLEEVTERVQEQERILSQHPPLEREAPTAESITRQSFDNGNITDVNRGRRRAPNTTNVADFPNRVRQVREPRDIMAETAPPPENIVPDFDSQLVTETIEGIPGNEVTISRMRAEMPDMTKEVQDSLIQNTVSTRDDLYEFITSNTHEELESVSEQVLRDAIITDEGDIITGIRKRVATNEFISNDESLTTAVRQLGGEDELVAIPELRDTLDLDDAEFDRFLLDAWERDVVELNQLEESTGISRVSEGLMQDDGTTLYWVSLGNAADGPVNTAIEDSIIRAFNRSHNGVDFRVPIADVLDDTGLDKETLHRTLRRMQQQRRVSLRSIEDPQEVTPRMRDAAVVISNVDDDIRPWMYVIDDGRMPSVTERSAPYFHGTKGYVTRFSNAPSASLTNELGPGLYLTGDIETARLYARAMPSKDKIELIANGRRTTEQGRVYPVDLLPDARRFDVDAHRDEWRQMVRDALPDRDSSVRFRNWSAPGRQRRGSEFLHGVRSQFIRRFGKDGYAQPYSDFVDRLVANAAVKYDVLEYNAGRTLNVINNRALRLGTAVEDTAATNTITEGLLSRYAVDLQMHNVLESPTTRAILDSDRLDMDVNILQKLEEAVGTQEEVTLDIVRDVMRQHLEASDNKMRRLRQEIEDIRARKLQNFDQKHSNIINTQDGDCF